jgi:predicted alpha/beta hydrolase
MFMGNKGCLMGDDKIEQPTTINTGRVRPAAPVAGWKRWHRKSRILLMLLGVVAIIVYLFQAGLAKQYAGLGAALCVIAVGGFLIWHAFHLFLEQDVIEEREIDKPDVTTPPSQSGQNLK